MMIKRLPLSPSFCASVSATSPFADISLLRRWVIVVVGKRLAALFQLVIQDLSSCHLVKRNLSIGEFTNGNAQTVDVAFGVVAFDVLAQDFRCEPTENPRRVRGKLVELTQVATVVNRTNAMVEAAQFDEGRFIDLA